MSGINKRITVFGGSVPVAGEPAYEEARQLGAQLAQSGCAVLTGGYIGTMEAVSRGANEAGGHVVGVTCDEIESFRAGRANRWVIEEIKFESLRDRMYHLIDACDGAIALPGGIGTLAEIAGMWNAIQTSGEAPRPLILLGQGWKATFGSLLASLTPYVRPPDRNLISFAPDVDAAIALLRTRFAALD